MMQQQGTKMRIGVIALLHESNTFSLQPTTLESFRNDLLLTGESVRESMAHSHHEVGGFFAGLDAAGAEVVPLFVARALPSGVITAADFEKLVSRLLDTVRATSQLDGLLVAPHGATVSESYPDADGRWLSLLREEVGTSLPIIGTLDAHANLSQQMVAACNAIVAYRTNPHLDQHARGLEAASLMIRTVRGEIEPVMAAAFPPLAISIDRQCTNEDHLSPLYQRADEQLEHRQLLSNSILLGFPYADVAEMGASVITIANGDQQLAQQAANELAATMWSMRHGLEGRFTSIDEALTLCRNSTDRFCLLDMGDNVGGGSAADGTDLLVAIHEQKIGPSFGCLFDIEAVQACKQAGVGERVRLRVGGKTDQLHGEPLELEMTVKHLCDGKFSEPQPRHGGFSEFDQGETAVCETDSGLTLMLTSRRMVPFSLQQLIGCGIDPYHYRILVAKGVNAPIAAYRDVCDRFIRVNTRGSTCADMQQMVYQHRRRPLFPFEQDIIYPQQS